MVVYSFNHVKRVIHEHNYLFSLYIDYSFTNLWARLDRQPINRIECGNENIKVYLLPDINPVEWRRALLTVRSENKTNCLLHLLKVIWVI